MSWNTDSSEAILQILPTYPDMEIWHSLHGKMTFCPDYENIQKYVFAQRKSRDSN